MNILFIVRFICIIFVSIMPYYCEALNGPDFLIIGVTKGGTSSLWHYLKKHPQVVTETKEIRYYHFNKNYDKGLEWYLNQFPKIEEHTTEKLICEASADYFTDPSVPARIAKDFPSVKLIILLRNPVDRAISHYQMITRVYDKVKPLQEMLVDFFQSNQSIFKGSDSKSFIYKSHYIEGVIERGLYLKHLREWLKYFPKEQFMIILSEEFFKDPKNSLSQVYDFLSLDPFYVEEYRPYNVSTNILSLDNLIKSKLEEFYQPFNQDLENFLINGLGLDIKLNWNNCNSKY